MDLAAPKRPHVPLVLTTCGAALQQLDEAAAKCRTSLATAYDERLLQPWRFSFGEHLISNAMRQLAYRQMFFNHMVHQAAQLGVYSASTA